MVGTPAGVAAGREDGVPLEAIEPRRLYRQVADQLRALIDQGEYPVGARLPTERDLAEKLGISRPTVREALIALEVEGRLKIRVGSGIYVAEPPRAAAVPVPAGAIEGPFELLRAREFVETAIVAEAAVRAGAEDVRRLDEILVAMEAGSDSNEELIGLDRAFHLAITATIGNAVLVRFVGELFDQRINPYFEQLSRYFENGETWRSATTEHRAIRDAIAAADPAAARLAMGDHLRRSQERLQRSFGDVFAGPTETPVGSAASNGNAPAAKGRAAKQF